MSTYETYRGNPIVIKPKSTNFGLGITIFNQDYSREDMEKRLKSHLLTIKRFFLRNL